MLKEFKEFIDRGNVIDLAVAVILGGAFGAIIASLVDDIIMPIIGALLGGVDFTSLSIQVGDAMINYGNFVQAIVIFVIIAFVLFLVVRGYNRMQKAEAEAEPESEPEPSTEEILLTEIRDILKSRPGSAS
jgi:large conductance mechanosensitive channel